MPRDKSMTAQQPQFSVNLCALSPAFNRVVYIDKAKRASDFIGFEAVDVVLGADNSFKKAAVIIPQWIKTADTHSAFDNRFTDTRQFSIRFRRVIHRRGALRGGETRAKRSAAHRAAPLQEGVCRKCSVGACADTALKARGNTRRAIARRGSPTRKHI